LSLGTALEQILLGERSSLSGGNSEADIVLQVLLSVRNVLGKLEIVVNLAVMEGVVLVGVRIVRNLVNGQQGLAGLRRALVRKLVGQIGVRE